MSNFRKRIIALVSLTCVALSMITGCAGNDEGGDNGDTGKKSNNNESSQMQEIEPITAVPFKWGSEDEGLTIDGVDINVDDPVKADHVDPTKANEESSEATTDKPVTTAYIAGEPITEVVTVTEANGQAVTEANGQPVTEVKIIANATPETPATNASENSTPDENAQNPETSSENNQNPEQTPTNASEATSEYISNTKGMYAMWIDISKKTENFVFNGSVIKITFKVKETAPDGIYNISLSQDLSSIDGNIVNPDTILNGSIKVGDGTAEAVDPSSMNGFTIYGDKVSAKQGDTVEFSINMKDNPGLAAMIMWYYYDSNALEVVNCVPDGEFADVSNNSTQTGEKEE